uniref:ATP synthase peripheral stalk subunit F6, mitochondrial n=1 Tax=Scophthalmus maximus TaxID=52904 RepID=A0A8D3CDI2_SCOMX
LKIKLLEVFSLVKIDVNCHLLMNTAPMDPIQKLFLDSIREYSSKSQASGGLVDAGSAYDKALAEEIAKLQRLYGGGDLESFPVFKFTDPSFPGKSVKMSKCPITKTYKM